MLKHLRVIVPAPGRQPASSPTAHRFPDHDSHHSGSIVIAMAADTTGPPPSQRPMLASQRAKEQSPQSGQDAPKGMGAFFPLGYKEAAYQWWTSVTAPVAQQNVLSYIPHIRPAATAEAAATKAGDAEVAKTTDPYGNRIWRTSMVQLSGKDRALNEFSVERVGEKVDDTLVVVHGYGAGLGFFYKNFEPLSRLKGWKLYALDMLGMGNSSRPAFKLPKSKDPIERTREAEDWFVDSLEEWRRIRKIERFTLLGHSLGGYLAVSYAVKYPGRLNKLILASPVGIPEDPYATSTQHEDSTMSNEFTQDQETIVSRKNPPHVGDNNNFLNARSKTSATPSATAAAVQADGGKTRETNSTGAPRRPLNKWIVWLWDANVSPFSLVRLSGPFGPRLVSGWTSRRFSHLPDPESRALHDYAYSLFRQRGSGEYALPYILAPGAFARRPIINRIDELGRQVIKTPAAAAAATTTATTTKQAEVRETGIPVVFMYGDSDWMDVKGGYAAAERLQARSREALLHGTPEEKRNEKGTARVVIVSKAGHHLYIDNPDEFNKILTEEMKATSEDSRKERESPRS
ncbi:alpha/beta hydrolase [Magnaporthiopsis poae ATCC 64411]|uniref:Alpha/beta hydrolase n=1 Tax=Magnaporthiopsis poae (strain ATCC 64411 / 73-15) TaxID=644358 RepID=A0A0C4DMK7_MAGP6|nr:alpha/beta hydrolase [Magnaporthiopsis poae ATCC 64411]